MAPNTGIASAGGRSLDPAMLHTGKWWNHSHIVKLNLLLIIPLITSYANGFDGSMMNGLQSVERWKAYFHYPTEEDLGLFNAIQSIGAFCAIPIAPYVSDGLGRRNGIAVGAFIVLIGAILQTATQNLGMFVGSRFLIGFGTTFAQMASPLLISEVAYPTHRAPLTSLYNSLWFSGSIVAAWTTFGTFRINSDWSWRIPSALQGLSSIVQLLFVWFLPESPRWLINRGRDEEAKAILARYHAGGDGSHPLISFEYNEIKEAIALEAEAARVSWLDLFRTPGNRRRMRIILGIGVFSQLSGNGIISYYLTKVLDGIGITSSNDQTLVNGILAIFNFIVATGASMTVERVGRRPFFIISTAGMLVSYAIITAMAGTYEKNQSVGAGRTLLAFVFIFNGFYDIAYTPLLGLAAMNFSVMGSIIFNQYTNPITFAALKWKYYLVYTIWLVFELVYVWLWATETKGRSLEETAALFDGEDAVAELSNRTGHDMAQLKHDGSDSQDEKLNIEHSKREIA
ncbi:related to hexose transporter protein [Serendipita indica DSM 11827]|uniref:Related to hexose transporter protein n=1 Tax=Serendipita indica (strain DSM 11827) TaxID=1109443 RepID=G4TDS5_SERID|nr:related to hexose transporter protein [Serendipita indica DSM 11827]